MLEKAFLLIFLSDLFSYLLKFLASFIAFYVTFFGDILSDYYTDFSYQRFLLRFLTVSWALLKVVQLSLTGNEVEIRSQTAPAAMVGGLEYRKHQKNR